MKRPCMQVSERGDRPSLEQRFLRGVVYYMTPLLDYDLLLTLNLGTRGSILYNAVLASVVSSCHRPWLLCRAGDLRICCHVSRAS